MKKPSTAQVALMRRVARSAKYGRGAGWFLPTELNFAEHKTARAVEAAGLGRWATTTSAESGDTLRVFELTDAGREFLAANPE